MFGSTIARTRVLCASARSAATNPDDVLTFWFGAEWSDTGGGMETDSYYKKQAKRWFMGGKAMDELCQRFVPLIRAAGSGALHADEWHERDGLVAQLVLLDQLARNAFRGTEEVFAYDGAAQAVASRLLNDPSATRLPAPAALFIATCLMHSESLEQHEACRAYLEAHVAASAALDGAAAAQVGRAQLESQLQNDLPAHTAVLRRFGRYPHRNVLKQRDTTPEEHEWLQSDECPGWAKSQQSRQVRQSQSAGRGESEGEGAKEAAEEESEGEAMRSLIVVDSGGEAAAHAELSGRALQYWAEWRCAAYPESPEGRFQESRWWEASGREEATEERCFITEGRASLFLSKGGGDAVEIAAGDWVTFRRGFLCEWVVHTTMVKRYAYFNESGEELA